MLSIGRLAATRQPVMQRALRVHSPNLMTGNDPMVSVWRAPSWRVQVWPRDGSR